MDDNMNFQINPYQYYMYIIHKLWPTTYQFHIESPCIRRRSCSCSHLHDPRKFRRFDMLWLRTRQCLSRRTMMCNQLGGVTVIQLSLNNKPMQYVSGGVCVYLYRWSGSPSASVSLPKTFYWLRYIVIIYHHFL